ncbi:hypothetical protein DZF91_38655 [Actinomadura logoneensis]|uniref:Fibronectin type-III domain-containing protein n=1 Tax=Actinomadura logoneensis TaxID=2293572 RepID=A0A372J8Q3_9ACTN|nr:hypothetical protein [Actinomadura logoneensis]RFU36363.1 hypothetical protein DZF91_38655 [Actinomadura logoneensis]
MWVHARPDSSIQRITRSGVALTSGAALLGAPWGAVGTAAADTAPRSGTPATVSADPLPTWQIDGVVWSMATVGDTVYATGNFSKARLPGTKPGNVKEVSRQNLLAFSLSTGNLVTSFNHRLDGQGLRVVASPDGRRVYVGGEFTTVDGKPHTRLAAFDTKTGKLVDAFKPVVSNKVRAIAATASTVYFGGNFFSVNGKARMRLAAVRAADGANIESWRPTADDDEVFALALGPGGKTVLVGGRFQTLNGQAQVGVGAVDASSGALAPWRSRPVPSRRGSEFSYVTDLRVQGDTVFGAADGEGGHWFDGRFAAKADGGELVWLDNCYGATYSILPLGKTVYSVSHAHDCTSLGAFRETSPVTWHRTLAETAAPMGRDQGEPGSNSNYDRQPVPGLLHWFPTLAAGAFTGQYQAAWAVTGNAGLIALGGEFPSVNGRAQQGLVRFAVRSKAPNKAGPRSIGAPRASVSSGKVLLRWTASWDMDNANLAYEVLRDKGTKPIGTVSRTSTFWSTPSLSFTDSSAPKGKHTYRIRVRDPLGNAFTTPASNAVSR